MLQNKELKIDQLLLKCCLFEGNQVLVKQISKKQFGCLYICYQNRILCSLVKQLLTTTSKDLIECNPLYSMKEKNTFNWTNTVGFLDNKLSP